LIGVTKDANSIRDAVHLTLTKSSWLPSMKYQMSLSTISCLQLYNC